MDDVHTFLKKRNSWLTAVEIGEKLGITEMSVRSNLNRLMKNGSVKYKKVKLELSKGWMVKRWKTK